MDSLADLRRRLDRMREERDEALSGEADAVRRAEAAELGCEIAYRREPSQAEGDAHEYAHHESMGPSYGTGECFVPNGRTPMPIDLEELERLADGWTISHRADPDARAIADRHYNRQKVGAPQFVPPGRALVLKRADAFWVTSFPFAEYVRHAWAGAWVCSAFRNEGTALSSSLIVEAVAATRWYFGAPPAIGMITFVNATKVRRKRDYGRCFRKAGFVHVGETKGGLIALQLLPSAMPSASAPFGAIARHRDYATEKEDSE